MKKTLLLFTFIFMTCISALCADKVSFSFLKGEAAMSYVVDWSNLTINGMKKDDWIERRNAEEPQYDAKHEYESELLPRINDFVAKANSELDKVNLFITSKPGRKYTLYICPQNFTPKGDNSIECIIRESATGKTMAEFVINGKGGTFGSMSNLWGDGMKSSGKKFGKLVCKHLGYNPTIKDKVDGVFSRVGIK